MMLGNRMLKLQMCFYTKLKCFGKGCEYVFLCKFKSVEFGTKILKSLYPCIYMYIYHFKKIFINFISVVMKQHRSNDKYIETKVNAYPRL